MPKKRLFSVGSVAGAWRLSLATIILIPCAAIPLLIPAADAEADHPPGNSSPPARPSLGPRVTDLNSRGYKIRKVVRIERSLNSLGITAQFGKTNKVGKYVELPKRLERSQAGEHFIVTWKYSGKNRPRKTILKFEYKLSKEEHVETITREYPDLRRGTYRLRIENTGASYRGRGHIEYWRVTIFADGELAAKKESFLWPVFRSGESVNTQRGA